MTILFFTIEWVKESAEVELLLLIMRLFTLASSEERGDGFYEIAAPPLIYLFRRNINLRPISWKIRTPWQAPTN